MIVISSPTLLREVLDRHANASANRPNSIIAGIIVADGLNMGLSLHSQSMHEIVIYINLIVSASQRRVESNA